MNNMVKLVQKGLLSFLQFVCLRNVLSTEYSSEKPLKYDLVAGDLRIALYISKKDAKERRKPVLP